MRASFALLLAGLAAQQVSATWNRRAGHFNTPEYNNNECSTKQKEGFNWLELPRGAFSGYDDFDFKGGWTCADRFGKGDSITKRSFNPRCVKNKVAKQKPASFDCKKRKDGFSIKEIQVSVEFDCDLEFHFKMPDGSTCKQVTACKKEGTIVQNTQCGGAIEVDVFLGRHGQKGREDCEIGFHQIDFDCTPPYVPSPPPLVVSSTAAPVTSTASSEISSSVLAEQPPSSTETPSSPPVTPSPPSVQFPSLPPYTNGTSHPTASPIPTPPAIPESSTTLAQTESSTTPEAATTSTEIPVFSSSTIGSPPEVPSPPPGPPGGLTPPECLPKCMNTWLTINTQCSDNTDANCYCSNPDFTKSVIDCVAAWATDAETQQALQYLIGICAPHIPENPGIITDCPSYIPLNPTPPAENTGGLTVTETPAVTSPPATPVTTITYDTTLKVPCSCAASTEILTTSKSTITVPQVIFTTQPPAQGAAPGVTPSEAPVELIPGTPAPVPAQTTVPPSQATLPPFPISSITVPSGLGTVTRPAANATSTEPAQFLGAAGRVSGGFGAVLFGAGAVVLAIL